MRRMGAVLFGQLYYDKSDGAYEAESEDGEACDCVHDETR